MTKDHRPEGGLGEAIASCLLDNGIRDIRMKHLAVRQMPCSVTSKELLAWAGIDGDHIAAAAADLASSG